jgi:hypothetical protein
MEELKKYSKEMIVKYPHFKSEIEDLVELCRDEIESGESPTEEIRKCMYDIDELVGN